MRFPARHRHEVTHVDSWLAALQAGDCVSAWDEFLDQYRRLIFAAIRHSTTDPDEVMDVFASVCEALRADDLARLRKWPSDGTARARFSTWLVTVIHRLTMDWFRRRHGRPQAVPPAALTPRQQAIYRLVFLERHPHAEAFGLLRQRSNADLSQREFGEDLRVAQRAYRGSGHHSRPQAVALSEAVPDPGPSGDHELHADEARVEVNRILATLGLDERRALRLFVVDGVPAAEVARSVGWPDAKAVYNRISRILKGLRNQLQGRGIGPGDF